MTVLEAKTQTANEDRITEFSATPVMPTNPPALPDCQVVLGWDGDCPLWRWETLEERDARLHADWYVRRLLRG